MDAQSGDEDGDEERVRHNFELPKLSQTLPAIVYVPSRKECEALAERIAAFTPCMPYHAGLSAADRDRAQAAFLAGDVSVIVATIAFGMGIDKHNVRTVIHTALPSSVEGYYQEIGRAGRDGKPSRAILMWSWADRRLHDWFLERDYPPVNEMRALFGALSSSATDFESLAAELNLDHQTLSGRLDKLSALGAANIDADGFITRGAADWMAGYQRQVDHKREQTDRMVNFAQGNTCRMAALVAHFGDREDEGRPCGKCDVCAPQRCALKSFREPDEKELTVLRMIMAALIERDNQSTGKLYRDNFDEKQLKRRDFEDLLGALEQNGLVYTTQDEFEKDGRTIPFRRASLTQPGRETGTELNGAIMLPGAMKTFKLTATEKKQKESADRHAAGMAAMSAPQRELLAALETQCDYLRLSGEFSKSLNVTKKTLRLIVEQLPTTDAELLALQGMGEQKLREYGPAILELVRGYAQRHPKGAGSVSKAQSVGDYGDSPQLRGQSPNPELVAALKAWRLQQAKSEGVQAFRVFGNKTLEAIAAHKPKTTDDLLDVPGIGPAKLEKYGEAIIQLIQR